MAKHTNSVQVLTANGEVTLTKVSTHRDYLYCSAVQFADGTQVVLAWHLTRDAGEKALRTSLNARIAARADEERGTKGARLVLLPVVNAVTGKGAPAKVESPVEAFNAAQGFVPQSEAEEAAQEVTAGTTATECTCQCGQPVSSGKNYRPGHDAKHAATVARLLVQGRTEGWDASSLNQLVESLPTQALRSKALVQAHRLGEKLAAKQAK